MQIKFLVTYDTDEGCDEYGDELNKQLKEGKFNEVVDTVVRDMYALLFDNMSIPPENVQLIEIMQRWKNGRPSIVDDDEGEDH